MLLTLHNSDRASPPTECRAMPRRRARVYDDLKTNNDNDNNTNHNNINNDNNECMCIYIYREREIDRYV